MLTSFTTRSRWAAVGAAIAVTLGSGGIGITQALTSSGEKAIYKPIEPCRLADTRPAPDTVGPRATALGANESYTLKGTGNVGECSLPAGSTALALNVTAIGATLPTFLTLYPTGTTRADASNLNPVPGQPPTPNAVNVDLNGSGQFDIYNLQGNVNVIIDVVGVFDDHDHDDIYYRKEEVDAAILSGGTTTDIYTEAEVDALLDGKADKATTYTKSQTYAKSETYSKGEVDGLVAGAGGGGAVFAVQNTPDPDGFVPLGNTAAAAVVVASVDVDAPSAGNIVLNYSGYVVPSNAAGARAGCSIGTGTDIDFDSPGSTVGEGVRFTLGGTHMEPVAAGTTTINLVCDKLNDGLSGTANIAHPTITAIFTPEAP